jgi:hypothetical protein
VGRARCICCSTSPRISHALGIEVPDFSAGGAATVAALTSGAAGLTSARCLLASASSSCCMALSFESSAVSQLERASWLRAW